MYGSDLAHIHHTGFEDLAHGAAPEIVRVLTERGIGEGLVVDLGCGSGILAAKLLAAGYRVLGVDVSRRMLEIARSTAPGAVLVQASMQEAELPACDAVVAIGEGMQYIPEAVDRVDTGSLFARVRRALRPGGVFVFDAMMRTRGQPLSYRRSSYGPGWAVHVQVTEDGATEMLTRVIDTERRVGCRYRRGREIHRVQLLDETEVAATLESLGFQVAVSGGYGGYGLADRRRAFVATLRPAAA